MNIDEVEANWPDYWENFEFVPTGHWYSRECICFYLEKEDELSALQYDVNVFIYDDTDE